MIQHCDNCKTKPICAIYADVLKYSKYATIDISKCAFKVGEDMSTPTTKTANTQIDPFTGKPKVDREKIRELSNKNRMLKEEKLKKEKSNAPKPKMNFEAKPLVLDHICNGCGGTTFKEDQSKCDQCGKDICSCCATLNGDSNHLLCPECWEKL